MTASRPLAWLAFVSSAWLVSCGSTATTADPTGGNDATSPLDSTSVDTSPPPSGQLPCAVDELLAKRCRSCHGSTPQFGAPMPLVTHADLNAPAPSDATKKVHELVSVRIHDDKKPMPQPPNARLTAEEMAVLDGFSASGAPSSTETCGAPDASVTDSSVPPTDTTPPAADTGLPPADTGPIVEGKCSTPDVKIRPKSAWTMPKDVPDQYVCYGFEHDVTTSKRHITAFLSAVGNTKIVHHVLLMQSASAYDPTPKPCSGGTGTTDKLIYAWGPGVGDFVVPKEAGFPAEKGRTHYLVQIHYSNLKALSGETDSTGFDLCTTDKLLPNDADIMAFGTTKISLPPKQKTDLTCTLKASLGLHVFGAAPHMHLLGRSIQTEVLPAAGGGPFDIGKNLAFDFGSQYWVSVPDVVIKSGDTIRTRCIWDNTTSSTVGFGEKTEDEMCYSFTMYWPKVTLPVWSWQYPAATSSCAPTK